MILLLPERHNTVCTNLKSYGPDKYSIPTIYKSLNRTNYKSTTLLMMLGDDPQFYSFQLYVTDTSQKVSVKASLGHLLSHIEARSLGIKRASCRVYIKNGI
jgi:hypothetical protein